MELVKHQHCPAVLQLRESAWEVVESFGVVLSVLSAPTHGGQLSPQPVSECRLRANMLLGGGASGA